jgi:hypothetical protein
MLGSLADTTLTSSPALITFFGVRWAQCRPMNIATVTARRRRWRHWSGHPDLHLGNGHRLAAVTG